MIITLGGKEFKSLMPAKSVVFWKTDKLAFFK
jgi:hypothetical protein